MMVVGGGGTQITNVMLGSGCGGNSGRASKQGEYRKKLRILHNSLKKKKNAHTQTHTRTRAKTA